MKFFWDSVQGLHSLRDADTWQLLATVHAANLATHCTIYHNASRILCTWNVGSFDPYFQIFDQKYDKVAVAKRTIEIALKFKANSLRIEDSDVQDRQQIVCSESHERVAMVQTCVDSGDDGIRCCDHSLLSPEGSFLVRLKDPRHGIMLAAYYRVLRESFHQVHSRELTWRVILPTSHWDHSLEAGVPLNWCAASLTTVSHGYRLFFFSFPDEQRFYLDFYGDSANPESVKRFVCSAILRGVNFLKCGYVGEYLIVLDRIGTILGKFKRRADGYLVQDSGENENREYPSTGSAIISCL